MVLREENILNLVSCIMVVSCLDRSTKPRKKDDSALSFDLNQAAGTEDDRADGSRNSGDFPIDHEDEQGPENRCLPATSASRELLNSVDYVITFKPVDFNPIRHQCSSHGLLGRDGLTESHLMDIPHGSEYMLTYEDQNEDTSRLRLLVLGAMKN
ncbi:hypothetical protein VitviT2T_005473 [Vitis vinifera]|uniref:Auxin-responsive protein n=1 Tax=Vitis vinifera TaxID=29760 RepID=A0ABY9BTR1_VITVI|nr:hypothetical protein VitviT2T_005473 [Vitis vinifera]